MDNCYHEIFDSAPEHIALINHCGTIQSVNRTWIQFGIENGSSWADKWTQSNYLSVCDRSADRGDHNAGLVAENIRQFIETGYTDFEKEYPCHSKTDERWYRMSMRSVTSDEDPCFVISHQNVTADAIEKERLRVQSLTDSMTGLGNRRYLDACLAEQWRRDMRYSRPVSALMIDIDYFKSFNDHYGHLAGDECLKKIGEIIQSFARRPGDYALRYGGEEFMVILGSTPETVAVNIARKILHAIRKLDIRHEKSSVKTVVTASIGVATLYPRQNMSESTLVAKADQLLYTAKQSGRNRVA